MASTDGKLYRVFLVAGERSFASRAELSRLIAGRSYDEFSYEEDGETRYLTWRGIDEYVSFAVMIGLLDGELSPYVRVEQVTKKGFEQSLGEKVENYAEGAGFPAQKIRNAIRTLISRTPAELPSPRATHKLINPSVPYPVFYKAVTVQAFQARAQLFVRSRLTFIVDDIFKDKND